MLFEERSGFMVVVNYSNEKQVVGPRKLKAMKEKIKSHKEREYIGK